MISVALTTYNGAAFIVEQLDSILNQTVPVDEIIISDDGSTDNTMSICLQYASRYPIIQVVSSTPNGMGPNKNFLKAFRLCRGEYILPSDQDDIWFPNKVELLLRSMNDGVDLVYAQDIIFDEKGNEYEDIMFIDQPAKAIYTNRLKGHTCVFRRELLELYNHSGCMSWDYVLCMYCYVTGRGLGIPDYLMKWRRHSGALTYAPTILDNSAKSKLSNNKKSKWSSFFSTHKELLKGRKSEVLRKHLQSRGEFILYLLPLLDNNEKQKFWKRQSRIALMQSEQTVIGLFGAGLLSMINSSGTHGIYQRIAASLFALRTPYNYWWSMHKEKYLG